MRSYVSEWGGRLASHALGADYPYSFSTADYRELNAFAWPGRPVWINRGVLDAAGDESQVAGVLAHEIAHVSGRHTARQVSKALWTTGLLLLVGALTQGRDDDWRAAAVNVAALATASSVFLKFSRNDEGALDREGVRLMRAAGYDPRGLLQCMQLLDVLGGSSPNASPASSRRTGRQRSRARSRTPPARAWRTPSERRVHRDAATPVTVAAAQAMPQS